MEKGHTKVLDETIVIKRNDSVNITRAMIKGNWEKQRRSYFHSVDYRVLHHVEIDYQLFLKSSDQMLELS